MCRAWRACSAPSWPRPQRDDWLFGEEDGRIDGRRLAQLVSSPAERRLFKPSGPSGRGRCQRGRLLIDCSGSMKG
jgi:cobaltochelatase CobT